MSGGVLAVVVAYHPQREALEPLLLALAPQVQALLVVDNTPDRGEAMDQILSPLRERLPNLRLHRMNGNLGIAAAQNVGIRMALEQEFDGVLLSDQDSLPMDDMVAALKNCLQKLEAEGVHVGCVCPEYFDETTRQVFRFQVQKPGQLFYSSAPSDPSLPWQEILTGISSGTLIPRRALLEVGAMREDLFIDHVDIEWCLRARVTGFRNFATSRARLVHRMGDALFQVWCFGWRSHSEYSPLRLYYQFRNFLLLCRLRHVTWRWWIRAGGYWLYDIYAQCLFAPGRLAKARAVVLGLWDGALGRSGRSARSF